MTITGLTSEQLSFWEENGYLIIPDAISQEVVKELVDETAKLLNG
jgi:phytanoyl-CoA hydroxylase